MIDKKKLKEDYKYAVSPMGVFAFKNTENGKVLLGSSLNIKNKDVRMKLMLKNGTFFNSSFQEDWNKFGEDTFKYEILEQLEVKDDANYNYADDLEILEMLWLDKFQPLSENCYNKNEKIRMV